MASRTPDNQAPDEEEKPNQPGAWIVTFSDCMTLLLCFFVLMLTYSSFDEMSLKRLSGAFRYDSLESIFPLKRSVPESMVKPVDRHVHDTEKGSETPTDLRHKKVRDPKRMQGILDTDAYRDRKVFYVPAEKMFWGNGLVMKEQGKSYLDMIASFLNVMPCFVIINDSRPDPVPSDDGSMPDPCLARAWEMVRYCVEKHGVAPSYFNIAADGGAVARERFGGRPVIEFALVAPRVYQ